MSNNEPQTCIGVLSTHDDVQVNNSLVELLDEFCIGDNIARIEKFHFIFTGGAFDRIFLGTDVNKGIKPVKKHTRDIILKRCGVTRLPSLEMGKSQFCLILLHSVD